MARAGGRVMRFAGKRVVITGAAGVYGRELAAGFAAEGAELLLSDRVAPTGARDENVPAGASGWHAADLTIDAEIDGLIAAAGAPDVLVNCAGAYPFVPLAEVSPAQWDRMMGVNLRAPFRLMQGIGRAMAARGGGAIVNVTSAAAEVIRGNGVPYGAAKCALEYLTRAFAAEYGARGVRVNAARPGFAEGSAEVHFPPGYAEAIRARSLLGRGIAPGEFAAVVLFLASDDAGYVTGAVLDSGGGGSINRREGAATRAGS